MELKDLRPNARNPRKITDEKLKMLKKSLDVFGDLSGIVFNRKSGQIISGHQRQKVLPAEAKIIIEKKYDKPTKKFTVAEGYIMIDGEKYKYREVMMDEVTEKAANLAANKHGGEFEFPAVADLLLALDAADFDMDLTGYDHEEIENLMAPIGDDKEISKENLDGEEFSLIIVCKNQNVQSALFEELSLRQDIECKILS